MPIFHTCYDTLAGRGFNIKPAITLIQQAIIKSNFPDKNANLNGAGYGDTTNPAVSVITNLTDEETSIPPLPFPILIEMNGPSSRRSESYVLADVRPYLSGTTLSAGNSLNIRQSENYNFFVIQAILTAAWCKDNKRNSFKFLGSAPIAVYASMISNAIERRYALEPVESLKIKVIAAAFYSRLFDETSTFKEGEDISVGKTIASATKTPVDFVFTVLDQIKSLSNIDDLVETIKEVLQNPRLDGLNLGTLVVIINGMWYGPYGKELIVAALEHPPTWVSILYSAFTDRGMKNSGVAKSAEYFKGSKGGDDFIRNMKILVANAKTQS
jgi:hypothetical protein